MSDSLRGPGDRPVTISDLLDYAVQVRDQLDDEGDPDRDEVLTLLQVSKAFEVACDFGLVRRSECPEQPLSRDGGRRKLDQLIPLLKARMEAEPCATDHGNEAGQRPAETPGGQSAERSASKAWPFLDRVPRTIPDLEAWLTEADDELYSARQ